MWDGHDGMGWWMLWGSALWLLFILGAVFVVAWVARWSGGAGTSGAGPAPPRGTPESPLDIARRRYAAGEISRAEFEQIKKDLE
jgi:putative membrane protein